MITTSFKGLPTHAPTPQFASRRIVLTAAAVTGVAALALTPTIIDAVNGDGDSFTSNQTTQDHQDSTSTQPSASTSAQAPEPPQAQTQESAPPTAQPPQTTTTAPTTTNPSPSPTDDGRIKVPVKDFFKALQDSPMYDNSGNPIMGDDGHPKKNPKDFSKNSTVVSFGDLANLHQWLKIERDKTTDPAKQQVFDQMLEVVGKIQYYSTQGNKDFTVGELKQMAQKDGDPNNFSYATPGSDL